MTLTDRTSTRLALVGLLAVTAAWGSTFFLLKDVLHRIPATDFLAVRFGLATLVLAAIAPAAVARLTPAARRHGVVLGLVFGAGQILQTVGLETTSASVSGFVTGMYVVFTPLIGAVLLGSRLSTTAWFAVALATIGLGTLSLQGLSMGTGEMITLMGALCYALHIVGLGRWSRSPADVLGLAVVQLATTTVVCAVGAVPGGVTLPQTEGDWMVLVHMALVAGGLAMVVQTWAQAHLAATRAAIVMTMEPVWAAGFAVAFAGEVLGPRAAVGGVLILAAMWLIEQGSAGSHPAEGLVPAQRRTLTRRRTGPAPRPRRRGPGRRRSAAEGARRLVRHAVGRPARGPALRRHGEPPTVRREGRTAELRPGVTDDLEDRRDAPLPRQHSDLQVAPVLGHEDPA